MSDASSENSSKELEPIGKNRVFSNPPLVVTLALVIFIISQLIAFLIVQAGHAALGAKSSIDQSATSQFFYILGAEALTIGAVLGLLRRAKLPLKAIGWGRRPNFKDVKWAIVGILVFYGLLIGVVALLSALIPSFDPSQPQDVGFRGLTTTPDKLIAFISLVILPPLGEETLIRGYLYSGLRTCWRFLPAMLLSSLLFAAAHLTTGESGVLWAAGVTTFVLSVILVYIREKTGALYAPVLIHVANNFLAFFVYIK